MEIDIDRKNSNFQFEAQRQGVSIDISASSVLTGTENSDFRPMELILSALGSCMSIDVLNILYKQRQQVETFRIHVLGHRTGDIPTVFKSIDMKVIVSGQIDEVRLAKAIKMSEETYCSVHKMLSPTVEINTTYHITNEQ
jgi:uncharacterized OsmC-like protein